MDDTQIDKFTTQWRSEAAGWRAQASRINRSKCFDGDRNMRVGMAIANERCAEQLEQLRGEVGDAPELLPDDPAVEVAPMNHVSQADDE